MYSIPQKQSGKAGGNKQADFFFPQLVFPHYGGEDL